MPKSPGKLVPRPRELRADFARKSAGRPDGVSFYRDTRYTRRTCRGLLRGELLVGLISLSSVRSRSTPRERVRAHGRGRRGEEGEEGGRYVTGITRLSVNGRTVAFSPSVLYSG